MVSTIRKKELHFHRQLIQKSLEIEVSGACELDPHFERPVLGIEADRSNQRLFERVAETYEIAVKCNLPQYHGK